MALSQSFAFVFVAPDSVIAKHFSGKLNHTNCPSGYSSVKLTSANAPAFEMVAPPNIKLLYTEMQPGKKYRDHLDSGLTRPGSNVKQIEYWLIDDRTSVKKPKKKSASLLKFRYDSNAYYVWPYDTIFKAGSFAGKRTVIAGEHMLEKARATDYGFHAFRILELELIHAEFFKRIILFFTLAVEAEAMFAEELNYVTVNVRHQRTSGNDFSERITFDKQYIAAHGFTAKLSYAAGEEKNPGSYQFQVQWSFRGGIVFPTTPRWEQGQMEHVGLYPPVQLQTIDFETDPAKLKAANFSRVTLQVRYKKLNEEYEQNIVLSMVKNDTLVSRDIYVDRDARGYVYRLIFYHTSEGKLALPWSAKINENYVYAVIPEIFADKNSDVYKNALESGRSATEQNGVIKINKILHEFKETMRTKY